MIFSSLNFIFLFFIGLLICYYVIPARLRSWRNFVLLAFSWFFYGYAGLKFLGLLILSIFINYIFGRLVCLDCARIREICLVLAVICNLALLGWFKYAGFFADILHDLGLVISLPEIVLPVGISFFTFQGLSYVFDVYRGKADVEHNPLNVALYISLFPQLMSGPIVRYTTIAAEIRDRNESINDLVDGSVRFLFGLSKKMLLAVPLCQISDGAFGTASSQLSTGMAWLGALAYTGQIYFDFSGYSDMAIGLAKIFGFHYPENFQYPYVSKSIGEFWRRWHISLGAWFRDYVYIPLGGNRCGVIKQIRNLLIVWCLTGIWHGAQYTFVFWGLYYGLLLIGERFIWRRVLDKLPAALQHLYTLFLVVIGWVFFRSGSLASAFQMLQVMFGFSSHGLYDQTTYYLLQYRWELVAAFTCILPVKVWVERFLAKFQHNRIVEIVREFGPKLLALCLGFCSFLALLNSTFNSFIYFQF